MVPPSARFPTRRAALAEEAARRALAGLGPELVLPQLRAQTVQELLAQPGGAGCELCGTLQTLTGALTQCVRRRPGWLYAMFPSGITCPVPARPALVQAAVLEALRPVLACGGQAVLEVKPRSRAALLCLRGGAPAGCCRCGRRWPGKAAGLWCLTAEHSLPRLHFAPLSRLPHAKSPARRSCWRIGSVCLIFFVGLLRGTVVSMAASPHRPMHPMAKLVSRVCSETLPRTSSKWPAAVRGRLQSKMPGCRTAAPMQP